MTDVFSESLSFFGRVTDALTRDLIFAPEYQVRLKRPAVEASYKPDGYFVFQALNPAAPQYQIALSGGRYQTREFPQISAPSGPVELGFAGEDELHVVVKTVSSTHASFDAIPFVPRIAKGAMVLGEGGFTSTLKTPLGGVGLSTVPLDSTAGLASGQLLRIVRSSCLLAKPGPYYAFPQGTTLLGLKTVERTTLATPLAGVRVRILQVNGQLPTTTTVSGLSLHHASMPGAVTKTVVLGTEGDLETRSDARGLAVLFFPGHWPLTTLRLELSCDGFVSQVLNAEVTAGQRTSITARLVPV